MIIELLAPAGNLEKLKIAVQYGADAVYLAGQNFGLRSGADNFSMDQISTAIKFAHENGKKVYITVNAFLHDQELDKLPEFLETLSPLKPDALICSDMGVIKTVFKYTSLPVHVSTQASVINSYHAEIWKDLGVKRIVVGRELSIDEAACIKDNTGLEIEMFIHGAMCMAYSGHCGISTYVAQRDSNRGGCIQNCRFRYTLYSQDGSSYKSHFMSSKDLCGLGQLPDFISAGINSIKIEGRMKSNLYIASSVRAYSQAIKEFRQKGKINSKFWLDELKKIPHREYTEASLVNPAGAESVYNQPKETGKHVKMAGTILEVDHKKSRCAILVKNKLKPGDTIEIMTFEGDVILIKIPEIINMIGTKLDVAQPHSVFWLPWQPGIEPRNVARIEKEK